jgi:transcriptional regulator with XRE-family HTH domain
MDGRKQLAETFQRDGLSQAQVAREVGCSPGYLSLLLDGKRWASPRLATKLSRLTAGTVPAKALVSPKMYEAAECLGAG